MIANTRGVRSTYTPLSLGSKGSSILLKRLSTTIGQVSGVICEAERFRLDLGFSDLQRVISDISVGSFKMDVPHWVSLYMDALNFMSKTFFYF